MLPEQDPKDDVALVELKRWIEAAIGFVVQPDHVDTFAHKLRNVLPGLRMDGLSELAAAVKQGHVEAQRAFVDAIAVNHTSFFREQAVIDVFTEQVARRWPTGRELKLWSAASSTGQELYSLALILLRQWGPSRFQHETRLMGTDISGGALQIASRGVYPTEQIERIPSEYRDLVEVRGGKLRVSDMARSQCSFRRLNLLAPEWPFTQPVDVTFCRNVLYYFPRESAREVLVRMYANTCPGGWLFTSSSEPLRDLDTGWRFVQPGVYTKDEATR